MGGLFILEVYTYQTRSISRAQEISVLKYTQYYNLFSGNPKYP